MSITLVWVLTNESTGSSASASWSLGGLLCNPICFVATFCGTCSVTSSLWLYLSFASDSVFVDFLSVELFPCIHLSSSSSIKHAVKGTNAYARACINDWLPCDDAGFVAYVCTRHDNPFCWTCWGDVVTNPSFDFQTESFWAFLNNTHYLRKLVQIWYFQRIFALWLLSAYGQY